MMAHIGNVLLGLWLMVSPDILGYQEIAADLNHVFGPVIVTFAFISIWEATRAMQYWNAPIGLWLIIEPWIIGYDPMSAKINAVAVGLAVLILSLIKAEETATFGGGWTSLWEKNPLHIREAKKFK